MILAGDLLLGLGFGDPAPRRWRNERPRRSNISDNSLSKGPPLPKHVRQGVTGSVWFEGESEIECDIGRVKRALDDLSELYVGVVSRMPGLTSVELVEQDSDSVTIRTNEGLMKRTNICKRIEAESVTVEFDEEYEAGSTVTTTSHFVDEFTASDASVMYRLVMSNVEASGFLGFFYRRLGSSKTGNAFLAAYKANFENRAE